MPQPKKGKTSKDKAVERARRAKTSKAIKEKLEHESYLKSQFDEDGNLLNIMETDEELLNDEQIFIVRLMNNLSEIDSRSIAIFLKTKYDKKQIKQLLDHYYSNMESKTWADEIFSLTYKCLGFFNLNDMFLDKFDWAIEYAIANIEPTNKIKLTEEMFDEIYSDCTTGLDVKNFNVNELISTLLTIYLHDQPPICSRFGLFVGEGEPKPRGVQDKVSDGFYWLCKKMLPICMVILSILGVFLTIYRSLEIVMHPLDAHGFPHPPQPPFWTVEYF
jgi:hypothetical protein